MKSLREAGSVDRNLWEREWVTFGTLLRLIDRDLGQVKSVADVGCGGRELQLGAQAREIAYRGFDIDDGDLELDPLPADDSTFDLVVALALVEHLHNPDNFLREVRRVLRPGGVLLLSTPNWQYASRHFYDNPAHVQPYTPVSLSTLLSAYALESVATFPGLRAKTGRAYLGKYRFLRAALRPARGAALWLPKFLSGRSTSFFALGVKPSESKFGDTTGIH